MTENPAETQARAMARTSLCIRLAFGPLRSNVYLAVIANFDFIAGAEVVAPEPISRKRDGNRPSRPVDFPNS